MVRMMLICLSVMLWVACETPYEPPKDWLKHENYTLKYTVYYPPTWKLSNQGNPSLLFYASSPKTSEHDHISENVNLISQEVAAETNLATYIDELEKKASNQLEDIEKLSTEELKYKGFPAVSTTYTATIDGTKVKWVQYAWIKEGRSYILTYSADISQFDAYKEVSYQIMDSFRYY